MSARNGDASRTACAAHNLQPEGYGAVWRMLYYFGFCAEWLAMAGVAPLAKISSYICWSLQASRAETARGMAGEIDIEFHGPRLGGAPCQLLKR